MARTGAAASLGRQPDPRTESVGLTPEINALAAVILAVAGLAVGVAALILGRNGRGAAGAG